MAQPTKPTKPAKPAKPAQFSENIWTRRFQLLLGLTLAGQVILGVIVYRIFAYSYVRAELALTAFLLICGIVVLSTIQGPLARKILLGAGGFILLALIALALATSSASGHGDGGGRPMTSTPQQFLAIVALVLAGVALFGKAVTERAARVANMSYDPNSWFASIGHLALAASAGVELLLQISSGNQVRLLPFTSTLYAGVSLNSVAIATLGAVVLFSLVSFKGPLTWLDGLMVLILGTVCALFQYTFGVGELTRLGGQVLSRALSGNLNLALSIAPLVIAVLALLTDWGRFIAPLWLAVQLLILQPFVTISQTATTKGVFKTTAAHPTVLAASVTSTTANGSAGSVGSVGSVGQLILYILAFSLILLALRLLLYPDRRRLNGIDGIAAAVIALAIGLTTWSLAQRYFQPVRTLFTSRLVGSLLSAAYSFNIVAYVIGTCALLALLFVCAYAFFNHSNIWLTRSESLVGTLLVLSITIGALFLLNIADPVGGQGSYSAAATLNPHALNPGLPSLSLRNQYVLDGLFAVLLLIYGIALVREHWTRAFGHTERALLLLSGFTCLLVLADMGERAVLPLVAANVQQLLLDGQAVFTPERSAAAGIFVAALIALLWLFHVSTLVERIVLAALFGLAALCACIYFFSALPLLLSVVLLLLTAGTLIVGRIERLHAEPQTQSVGDNNEAVSTF